MQLVKMGAKTCIISNIVILFTKNVYFLLTLLSVKIAITICPIFNHNTFTAIFIKLQLRFRQKGV